MKDESYLHPIPVLYVHGLYDYGLLIFTNRLMIFEIHTVNQEKKKTNFDLKIQSDVLIIVHLIHLSKSAIIDHSIFTY